jgi:acetylornithine deacetylase/succinyl-diaminopimelate desuccinylase-like protein
MRPHTLSVLHRALFLGGTDSKHYANLSRNGILRFVPTTSSVLDAHRVHGVDERTAVEDFGRAVCVYQELFRLFSEPASQLLKTPF